ncbi:molybdopterin-dependent oxidoreductase [Nocardioides sp. TF02-7]|nr:molybdopterin-dependent oxidoreductase [Nocardioides sp. TF02-7]
MAEAHPVGFQWVMEAKARGAKVIHVDPRFTRTSALADTYVPLRVGTDIAFLGGIVNYVLSNELDFRDYVVNYTNAATILSEDYVDTEDLDGLFSGFDPESRTYDPESWQYASEDDESRLSDAQAEDSGDTEEQRETASGLQNESHGMQVTGNPPRDETLQHPRCVYQVLKRHFARYTPEMVARTCGVSEEQFLEVCRAWTESSGRDRTTALVYSVGWTQHSVGVQYIRTGAILQLLLGNMGRPGGGIMALRGHASIQGSTDIPTLFNLLPGYLPMPNGGQHHTIQEWIDAVRKPGSKGFWSNAGAYGINLLKAYWGDHATADNDYCFDYLPRITGDHGTYRTVMDMIDGKVKGYFLLGQNPAVGSAHGRAQRLGMANLDWVVVRDLFEIESATFWKSSPEVATGEIVPEQCRTEVFLMPAASYAEKEGTFTQTQRMLQWRDKAVDPPANCRSELWFFYHLGRMVRGAAGRVERGAGPAGPRPRLGLPDPRGARRAQRRGGAEGDQRLRDRHRPAARQLQRDEGRRLDAGRLLDLHRRLQGRRQPGAAPQARLGAELRRAGVGAGRGRPTGGCSTTGRRPTPTAGRGASARPTSGGTRRAGSGPASTCRTSRRARRRRTCRPRTPTVSRGSPATTRSSCRATGRARSTCHRDSSTARCRPTTSRSSRRSRTRSTASRPTRPARSTTATTTRCTPRRRRGTARCSRSCSPRAGSPSTTRPAG